MIEELEQKVKYQKEQLALQISALEQAIRNGDIEEAGASIIKMLADGYMNSVSASNCTMDYWRIIDVLIQFSVKCKSAGFVVPKSYYKEFINPELTLDELKQHSEELFQVLWQKQQSEEYPDTFPKVDESEFMEGDKEDYEPVEEDRFGFDMDLYELDTDVLFFEEEKEQGGRGQEDVMVSNEAVNKEEMKQLLLRNIQQQEEIKTMLHDVTEQYSELFYYLKQGMEYLNRIDTILDSANKSKVEMSEPKQVCSEACDNNRNSFSFLGLIGNHKKKEVSSNKQKGNYRRLLRVVQKEDFDKNQIALIRRAMETEMLEEDILQFANAAYSAGKMESIFNILQATEGMLKGGDDTVKKESRDKELNLQNGNADAEMEHSFFESLQRSYEEEPEEAELPMFNETMEFVVDDEFDIDEEEDE